MGLPPSGLAVLVCGRFAVLHLRPDI